MIRKVCVMGWPVAHSRSPLIHNHWIAEHRIPDARYELLAVKPEDAAETIRHLHKLDFVGANVTVPHKETAFATLTRHDAVARRLKAVNTIVTLEDGTLEGRNTDGYGFIANLKDGAPDWRPGEGPAVMLGAGGAARAIAAALETEGVREIRIVNRTPERAEALIRDLGLKSAKAYSTAETTAALGGAGLLVNTTTLGMKGESDVDIDISALPRDAIVTDIVYTPLETGLLKRARLAGHETVDGLGMLLHQAVPGFEAWFGVRPHVTDELREIVLADLGMT
ncbi:shikimate dehydrogenase [Parvibaculum sp.]|jgi:shikimate dehydrogenase|uniref:shikimate dehydrogenase n=1 Tax=Parvibaculum sp. TaxID=2024848 RepID=UPI001B2BA29A|nr:shikimate dehydrogenase [Parvibaculum sp.]MBO6634650.1 shikimate dehydrogenase [Parvibaculum sp.]MBO6677469.1 shikimate dehydrogenase [Parvibaculum sp.]MBO6685074.1 shikimate dehydrogenase [Parvibaculum sp.]MBO6903431.1 shikimate dehydrogenase [Parvibaculum sp.]